MADSLWTLDLLWGGGWEKSPMGRGGILDVEVPQGCVKDATAGRVQLCMAMSRGGSPSCEQGRALPPRQIFGKAVTAQK